MSTRTLRLAVFIAALVAVAGVILLTSNVHAGSPQIEASCDGLSVRLSGYDGTELNNTAWVVIDGNATTIPFGPDLERTFGWDPLVTHTWQVKVDAGIHYGDPLAFDIDRTGTQAPCPAADAATTTVAVASDAAPAPGAPSDPSMPVTGFDAGRTLGWALTLGCIGFVMAGGVAITRREH